MNLTFAVRGGIFSTSGSASCSRLTVSFGVEFTSTSTRGVGVFATGATGDTAGVGAETTTAGAGGGTITGAGFGAGAEGGGVTTTAGTAQTTPAASHT
jgi:hypothetical protein